MRYNLDWIIEDKAGDEAYKPEAVAQAAPGGQ